jgi:SNF2 family DNA or RNA helicase
MLNFRKLKQDFSSSILKEGKQLYDKKKIVTAKILRLDSDTLRIGAKVIGNFENTYESEIEIDRFESQTIHSNCDCSYRYDCQHIAAIVYHLEEHINTLLVNYSKEKHFEEDVDSDLLEKIKEAHDKDKIKKDANYKKQVLDEYITSSLLLSISPFFQSLEKKVITKAEPAIIINPKSLSKGNKKRMAEFQLALRLPFRSKPLHIPFIKRFLDSLKYKEAVYIAGKRYFFSMDSFDVLGKSIIELIVNNARFNENVKNDRAKRVGQMDFEVLGILLANVFNSMNENRGFSSYSEDLPLMKSVFMGNLETPLQCSFSPVRFRFELEYIEPPASKILMNPMILVDQHISTIDEVILLESVIPGVIYKDVYYRFADEIKRVHLQNLEEIRSCTVPEPLFGAFVENLLPELKRYADVSNQEIMDKFVTMPFTEDLKARCALSYVDGELEATLYFIYDGIEVHSISNNLSYEEIKEFVTKDGILARDLVEERKIIEELFQDFIFSGDSGTYIAKTEKKIVEFMTETIPKYKDKINFECPQNLLDQFIYDKTTFVLKLDYKDKVGYYNVDLKVKGDLKGVTLDRLWECMTSNRSFIELSSKKRSKNSNSKFSKILVLDFKRLKKVIQLFDEMGIKKLDNHFEDRPLWSLVNIDEKSFEGLPVKFSITNTLKDLQKQMLGEKEFIASPIPKVIKAVFRDYQKEGVHWLERLKKMYLNGILADDMGLGKTLQAIAVIRQQKEEDENSKSLVICPTSLLHNWKEEFYKFNSKLKILIVDGIPNQRKKLIGKIDDFDVIITSYTLMQKDIDLYKEIHFKYAVLDEAQHIKNRGTRNAKSVKMVKAAHRLILTGTPIENSLDELWSLFDFSMPGFLSSYDRFVEKYVRTTGDLYLKNMGYLKRKVSPFILRRMKTDVLKELPPVSELTYHCKLSKNQLELYKSYAESAKEELFKLVEKEGFERVQIHVLATLTRLKQICCHPAIFAKEKAESGDSAKYEMLLELLQTLVEGGHKTVIFSQYTKMLQIMREDFEQRGIKFSYLDGSTKNRLQIVNEFNENVDIPVFLISLKAGGTGLNITGADTVIHYDMWWNPAVENQATDRVHRIGQEKLVSCYKLITLNSIEEKILELQKRKKGLVKKVISDDEAISKLTWEDVLELLQT